MANLLIEHPLGSMSVAEAKERLTAMGEYFTNKHGINVTWSGDAATVKGKYLVVTIDGGLRFQGGKAIFEGKDPGMLWRGKAREYIQGKIKKYLDAATRVADLPRR
ncbi:MAG TPA: polyhydroxyalkanoic acid system family protein [Haliangiales bacterium]|nr:polyhydroxyalkanoic acid system family protein [Haliangiales bacterium]